jgi:cell wall-associated NlpC family hydrolase
MLVRALAKGGMITGGAVKGGLDGTWGLTPDYVNKTYQGFLSVMANSVENFVRAGVNTANAQARLLAGPAQGQSILSYAGKFAGKVPYVWGGSSPVSGWDCSGFVSYVYNKFGLYNGRTTAAGFQNWARSSAAVPGGLVFFGNPAHHVGFVVNGKTMLSALGRQWGTLYSSLAGNSGYGIPPSWAAQMRGISGGIGFAAGPSATGSAAAAQNLARSILWAYGWGQNQWPYLQRLWQQESSWSAYAVNRSSGAYGIPQALPSVWDHPYALGDYANQVRWGLAYISGRYPGGPAEAWAHEVANNWYGRGGQVLPHGMATGGTVGQFRDKLGREQASELKSYAEVARHRHQGGFTRTTYSELDTLAKRQAAEVLAYREATGRGLSDQTLRHFLAMVHAEQRTAGDKGLQKLSGIGKLKQDLADLNRIGGNPPAIPDKIAPPPPPAWKVPGHLTLEDWWKYLRAHQAHEISDYRALRRSFEHDIAHAPLNSWIHRNRATLRSELGTLAKRQEREQHAFDEIAFRGPGANKKTLAALRAAIKTELRTTGDKALSHWPEGHLGRIYGLRHWLYALDKLASMAVPPSTEKVRPPLVPPAPQARVLAGEFSFDRGGTLKPGWNLAYNGLGRDEDLVPAGGGGGDIHVHLHNEGVIGSRAELDNWLSVSVDRLARQGRLTYALRRSFSAS